MMTAIQADHGAEYLLFRREQVDGSSIWTSKGSQTSGIAESRDVTLTLDAPGRNTRVAQHRDPGLANIPCLAASSPWTSLSSCQGTKVLARSVPHAWVPRRHVSSSCHQ